MTLPDPGDITFTDANSANTTQTESLAAYETAYNEYTQKAQELQDAQNAFDEATQNAESALDQYSQDLAAYNSKAQDVGADPNPPAPATKKPRTKK